ncbi:hypothetical protein [Flavisolibacter tropicus]|uniref:Uncharacterized protein n=1 Tax=Flavisolibacter tropicus TaxID=1492898 RepID=A0A172TT00_9BACT|nr:hypothetical protein [Flavisolibacter tropicus]ANE50205.1 hypothetical protein SY85_06500 [Flavisolibacter tropicus]
MKGLIRFFIIAALSTSASSLFAQDTLPHFSARHIGNGRVIIGWMNTFTNINQISIQRSHDSLQFFKTILTVADPKAIQNGYADNKAPNDHMFYRIFYAMEGGSFYFTPSKRPIQDTAGKMAVQPLIPGDKKASDTAKSVNGTTNGNIAKKPTFVPSFYVYTNKEGYVYINLPDADSKKYSIKFFEENNTPLFEIKPIKDKALTLDKANFIHAGWFNFELYDDDKLVERHKFYLNKDF